MLMTAAFLAVLGLAPGDTGALKLVNVRTTCSVLGPARPDNKLLPGDTLVLSFDIEGAQVNESGKVLYSIAMEVSDSAGKVEFKQLPRDLEAVCSLGGHTVPAAATLQIGLSQPAGKYTVKVSVTDRAAKSTQSLTRTYELLPRAFGLVGLKVTADPEGRIEVPLLGKGQSIWINFVAVGFERDKARGQPDFAVTLRLLDEKGQPTLAKPFAGDVNRDVPQSSLALPMQFMLDLNRAGKFTAELKATDKVSGKTAVLSFPLTVLAMQP